MDLTIKIQFKTKQNLIVCFGTFDNIIKMFTNKRCLKNFLALGLWLVDKMFTFMELF